MPDIGYMPKLSSFVLRRRVELVAPNLRTLEEDVDRGIGVLLGLRQEEMLEDISCRLVDVPLGRLAHLERVGPPPT